MATLYAPELFRLTLCTRNAEHPELDVASLASSTRKKALLGAQGIGELV